MAPDPTPPEAPRSTIARVAPPTGLRRWVPGLDVLRTYERGWLLKDVVAGVVLTAVLVPVGMGYSQAAGLPAIYGLYATIVPLLAYALFGPSRIFVLGPDSSLAGVIAATVAPLAAGSEPRAVALASMLAIFAGLFCAVAGLARLGFVTDLLSKPVRIGFLNGIAVTVLVGQLPKVLGFPAKGDNLVAQAANIGRSALEGKTNWTAVAIGASCLAIVLGFKRWAKRVPGVLVAVVGATLAVWLLELGETVKVVGALPQGLPSFVVPEVSRTEALTLAASGFALALLVIADTAVLSRTFALRHGYHVDPNQEMIALGVANVLSGLFQGFAISSSSSRTPVAESSGSRTQVTGVVGAACVAALLVFAPNLAAKLPIAALGAVVIAACAGLVDVEGLRRLWALRRQEFALALICFLGVALVGVIEGIFLSVVLALAAFIWRAWRPYSAVLGRVDGLKGYHDITRYPHARRVPGLVLFRWDAPLFFANAAIFREQVREAVADSPTPVNWVVVAAEPVTDIDTTAADVLLELDRDLEEAKIELVFAEMKDPVKDHLKRYGAFHALGPQNFLPTLGQAVDRYLAAHEVEWVDWADAKEAAKARRRAAESARPGGEVEQAGPAVDAGPRDDPVTHGEPPG